MVHTEDRQGILARIVSAIAEEKTNIKHVDAKSLEGRKGVISLTLDISDRSHLEKTMKRLRGLEGINHVERIKSMVPEKRESGRGAKRDAAREPSDGDSAEKSPGNEPEEPQQPRREIG